MQIASRLQVHTANIATFAPDAMLALLLALHAVLGIVKDPLAYLLLPLLRKLFDCELYVLPVRLYS